MTVSRLEQERLIRKLSRAKVAEILNIHENTLMDYESNPGNVRYKTAKQLSELYECSVEELFADFEN